MRIIHNNLETQKEIPKTQEYVCVECGSTIEVDPDDIHEGWLGAYYFTCPVCGKESMTDIETELPTKDTIEFPKHFYRCTTDDSAVDVSDEDIQKYIRRLANIMWNRTNEETYVHTGTGNTVIFVLNQAGDGEYHIIVCKNYWEGDIKANPEDEYYGGD